MAWISIDQSMLGDRLRILHKEIGCSRNEAIGILVSLWIWGIDNADEDGTLTSADLADIAEQLTVGMSKELDPDKVAQILVETGWLYEVDGSYRIADQYEVCGIYKKIERERIAHNERTERYRERKRSQKKKSSESDAINDEKNDVTIHDQEPKKKKTQTEKYGEDFEKLWDIYPRKDRKSEAFKCYAARIKEGHDPDTIMKAAQNYAQICEKERKEKKYTLMAKTFLGSNLVFRDYVPRVSSSQKHTAQRIDSGANPFR